jgi:alpha-ketoglutarate-dependent taurine dioxygenase
MTQVAQAVEVRPQSGWTGAEIHGVDLTTALSDAQVAEIRAALLKWKVVFFRDQFIGHDDHLRFARAFGAPTPAHPLFDAVPDPNYPAIYPIFRDRFKARYATGDGYDKPRWHADVTAALNPPAASILRAEVIPPYGGDTQWSNTIAAYEGLSAPLRKLADGLRAVHRFSPPEGATATEDYERRVTRRPLLTEHPVVRVHPETGGQGPLRQPRIHQPHRRCLTAREPSPTWFVLRRARPARIHRSVQVGAGEHCVLGQPIDRAPRAEGLDARPRPPAVPRHPRRGRTAGTGRTILGRVGRRTVRAL